LFTVLAVALLATFIAALPSQAAWDDRFWPANEKPPRKKDGTNWVFQADVITSNIYYAVDERIWAIAKTNGISYDEYPYGPRFPDKSLEELKFFLLGIINQFLDQTRFPSPYDPTSIIVTTTNTSYLQLIYWNETNILTHCQLPTNFFRYTPPRNLAGHEGTGAEHWTNSAAYGWDAMRKVITNLIYTYENKGVLINETKTEKSIGVEIANDPFEEFTRPNGQCLQEIDIDGPYSISELSISNYAFNVEYEQSVERSVFYVPSPTGPFRVGDGFNADRFLYKIDSSFGNVGFKAAYIGTTNSPISTNNHIAYTFYLEDGIGPEECGFTPFPPPFPRPPPPRVVPWKLDGTISALETTSDQNVFLFGSRYGINVGCDAWNYLEEFYSGFVGAIPDFSPFLCDSFDAVYFADTSTASGSQISSDRIYNHVIQWDFTYK
jgi:hypothetical protein